MKHARFGYAFEALIEIFFQKLSFHVDREVSINGVTRRGIDMVLVKDQVSTWVEVKFYRDDHVRPSVILTTASQFSNLLKLAEDGRGGLIVVSAYVSESLRSHVKEKYGLLIWDRSSLYQLIKNSLKDDKLLEEFEQLILEAKQGLDTKEVFEDVEKDIPETEYDLNTPQIHIKNKQTEVPLQRGQQLTKQLKTVPPGRDGWRRYEMKCVEILKYLFDEELAKWDEQKTTDDELSRFDMVCKIKGHGNFWTSLIQSFQSRYVLFEFKNYTDPIGQDQIYTTERYLYLRGLRSVGFIISRLGGQPQAEKAAKGALREHGKLIIILDNNDLIKMLEMKDVGDVPSDHLSDKLDSFLISLSR